MEKMDNSSYIFKCKINQKSIKKLKIGRKDDEINFIIYSQYFINYGFPKLFNCTSKILSKNVDYVLKKQQHNDKILLCVCESLIVIGRV